MSQKRLYLVLAVVTAVLLAAFAYRARQAGPLTVQPVAAPFGVAGSQQLLVPPTSSPALEDFSVAAQHKVEQCLGKPAGNFVELESLAAQSTGAPQADNLEWKVVQFDDESGHTMRARLERETGAKGNPYLKLSLFSVDEEGLPDRVPLAPGETLDNLLRGKRITKEIESHELKYANDFQVTVEKEDGVTQKYAVAGGGIRLACENTADGPDCHCVH
jgi:hypothetical protein